MPFLYIFKPTTRRTSSDLFVKTDLSIPILPDLGLDCIPLLLPNSYPKGVRLVGPVWPKNGNI